MLLLCYSEDAQDSAIAQYSLPCYDHPSYAHPILHFVVPVIVAHYKNPLQQQISSMPLNLVAVAVDNESMIDDADVDDRLVDDLLLMGKITCRIPLDQPWRVMTIVWMRMSNDADIVAVADDDERRVVQETLVVCQVRKEMGWRMWYRQLLLLLHTSLAEYHMARSLSVEIPVAVVVLLLLPLPHLCSCVADS